MSGLEDAEAGPGPLEARARPGPRNIYYLDSQDTEYRAFYAQAGNKLLPHFCYLNLHA